MTAYGRACRAAARAEVEPLVRQMLSLKKQWEQALLNGIMNDDKAADLLASQYDKAADQLASWLSPQVGDKGDGNAQP